MISASQVQELIQRGMPDAQVIVEDPLYDGTHLQAIVVSPAFASMSRIEQHKEVYRALGNAFDGPLHALKLTTLTPEQARERNLIS